MTPEQARNLKAELDVIINSAASVDFNSSLPDALRDNFHNNLRVLRFAKECAHLDVLVHVSTAYVNSNLRFLSSPD